MLLSTFCRAGGLLALLCLRAAAPAAAQAPAPAATGSLTGTVLDSASRQPVAYATVVLLPAAPADKPITGVAADDQGRFALTKLAAGAFRLQVSFVGYATRTRAVTVTAGATAVGPLRLPAAAQLLGEAVVIGSKPVVEVRADRLVYNADQDVSNAGGTAADVLSKAPLLAVDGDGNVKMRGSGNFKVLVNNKPSPSLARNLAEALKSIPADQIKSVEIITTPPAKYDGEGTAGIINIVLKKGVDQGLNGRVGASGGNRNTALNTALNFKKGKVGFTSSANTGTWNNRGESSLERVGFSSLGTDTLRQMGSSRNNGRWYYGTLGLDFDPAEHHSLSLATSVNGYNGNSTQSQFSQDIASFPVPNPLYTRATTTVFGGLNVEATGTYTRTFAQARREWSTLAQYALNNGTAGYDFDQFNNSPVALEQTRADYREHSRGRTPGHEYTFQTDFTQPFGDKKTLELGLKAIFRRTGSVAAVDTLYPARAADFARAPRRATDFSYAQNVQAAYATYSFGVGKKLTSSLGSRLERTALNADFRTSGTGFDRSYLSLLPNGNARYAFSDATSLRLAYSRRITRPFIDYLNPYVDRSDAKNISYGNPNLAPELTDSYELSYNTTFKTTTVNASLSVRHTGNAIEQVRFSTVNPAAPLPPDVPTDPSVTAQTFANVAANTFYQFNVYFAAKPLPKWDLSAGPDVQYIVRRSPALNAERQGFTAGLNVNTSYKLDKGVTLQSFVYASLPTPEIQGRGAANLYYQLGAKKTLFKEKADLVLNLGSPFNAYWPYRSTTTTAYFNEHSEFRAYQRSFRLSFSYRFGQEQQGRQRKQVNNDDTKGGASKQGGG
ncbi:TonB-dependent receptor domain-containing protein [Hymenobacter caeli]|uniref:Outer membrane receptor protein involved in Fe transport n=1 Tax=Hymenobacter caeli TaxID=2735894 RepID=A0ABX2FVL1_9BACT|nr:TonB-dependent receptor [Hymenobacter caeli]NRT20526.1 outer membrane receptor protein involved in Fe transport [Hymenobacter caeli]